MDNLSSSPPPRPFIKDQEEKKQQAEDTSIFAAPNTTKEIAVPFGKTGKVKNFKVKERSAIRGLEDDSQFFVRTMPVPKNESWLMSKFRSIKWAKIKDANGDIYVNIKSLQKRLLFIDTKEIEAATTKEALTKLVADRAGKIREAMEHYREILKNFQGDLKPDFLLKMVYVAHDLWLQDDPNPFKNDAFFEDKYLIQAKDKQVHIIDYSSKELIGSGGQATVYKVRDVVKGIFYAMKEGESKFTGQKTSLTNEIRMLNAVKKLPNVQEAPILSAKKDSTYDYLYVTKLYNVKFTEWQPANYNFIGDFLSLLKGLNEAGVYHGDIKPDNILVDDSDPKNPKIKLIDFGIATKVRLAWSRGKPALKDISERPVTPELLPTAYERSILQTTEAAEREYASLSHDLFCIGASIFHKITGQFPYDVDIDLRQPIGFFREDLLKKAGCSDELINMIKIAANPAPTKTKEEYQARFKEVEQAWERAQKAGLFIPATS